MRAMWAWIDREGVQREGKTNERERNINSRKRRTTRTKVEEKEEKEKEKESRRVEGGGKEEKK